MAEPEDIHVVELADKTVILVGTAHVSRESTETVREVIRREHPDCVAVELDEQRYRALSDRARWESLDLQQVIRSQQLATLLVQLLLTSLQKRIGQRLGVEPGSELLEAVVEARAAGIPVEFVDRELRATLLRAWRGMSLWQRAKLLSALLAGIVGPVEVTEDDLRELRGQDALSELMDGLAREMPSIKRVVIDERDLYLAERIRRAPGRRVVAVVGAGHVAGLVRRLGEPPVGDLSPLRTIPPAARLGRSVGWAIPVVILGSLGAIAWRHGGEVAGENLTLWVLANGIPCALGAALALAHPLTIAAAFVSAPITSLTPVVGAGYVTAFVQAWMRPPRVRDFRSVTEDAGRVGRWWSNRLLRVLLAFVLPTLGSIFGTLFGGARIVSNLF